MEVIVDESCKLVEIWLTQTDSRDEHMERRLKNLCREFKEKKYRAVVYRSGKGDLEGLTAALVRKNYRKSIAEKA